MIISTTSRLVIFALILWPVFTTQTRAQPTRTNILMVGNSYTYYNDMPVMLQNMLNNNPKRETAYKVEHLTRGGAKLYEYITDGSLQQKLAAKSYDIVFLQDQSAMAFYTDETPKSRDAFQILTTTIRQARATPLIISTWPRHKNSDFYTQPNYSNFTNPKTPLEMGIELYDYYRSVSRNTNTGHVPIVKYWLAAMEKYPELNLYQSDGSHPSVTGSYLLTLGLYQAITGEAPGPNTWKPAPVTIEEQQSLLNIIQHN